MSFKKGTFTDAKSEFFYKMKVAIVHYWFTNRRGGERVVESLLKLYPKADIYTLFYDKNKYGGYLNGRPVFTSILDNRLFRKNHHLFFPLFPLGIKSLRLKKTYDLVISSESGPAKGIKVPTSTPHICYVHTPMRYCWSHTAEYTNNKPLLIKGVLNVLFYLLKKWDETTINNVDYYIANSNNVNNRIKKYYKKDSEVIFPPIRDELFSKPLVKKEKRKQHFLSFGALVPYKRIDLLIKAFKGREDKLVVIGTGPEYNKLKKEAPLNVELVGHASWQRVEELIHSSNALLFPGEEDFGMIPLEVMAYGLPVIAFAKGGALETVMHEENIEKSTGVFFHDQTVQAISDAIDYFNKINSKFDPQFIRNHAKQFREEVFLNKFKCTIKDFLNEYKL